MIIKPSHHFAFLSALCFIIAVAQWGCGGWHEAPPVSTGFHPNFVTDYPKDVTTPRFLSNHLTYKLNLRTHLIANAEGTADDSIQEWIRPLTKSGLVTFERVYGDTPAMIDISFAKQSEINGVGLSTEEGGGRVLGVTFADKVEANGFTPIHRQTYILDTLKNPNVFAQVVLHEFGHALCINGESSNSRNVMYPIIPLFEKPLTQEDVNSAAYGYRKR